MTIWYNLCSFCANLVHFYSFGIMCQEKSGSPVSDGVLFSANRWRSFNLAPGNKNAAEVTGSFRDVTPSANGFQRRSPFIRRGQMAGEIS
jgi:hypothetical protein